MATDPHLSDAQIADVSMKVYDSDRQHLADFREEALKKALTEASALATAQSERLVQAEAALQALDLDYGKLLKEANQREAERNASTEAIEDWREWARAVYPASFARDADETYRLCIAALVEGNAERAAAQAERIAQLETVLKDVLNAARSRYPAKVIQSMAESSL